MKATQSNLVRLNVILLQIFLRIYEWWFNVHIYWHCDDFLVKLWSKLIIYYSLWVHNSAEQETMHAKRKSQIKSKLEKCVLVSIAFLVDVFFFLLRLAVGCGVNQKHATLFFSRHTGFHKLYQISHLNKIIKRPNRHYYSLTGVGDSIHLIFKKNWLEKVKIIK